MKLSNRATRTAASPLRSLENPKDKSVHVHRLNIGQPDIHTPQEFYDGLDYYSDKVVAYDAAVGNKTLISEWTKLINTQYNTNITHDEMLITSGSSEALTFVLSICCDVNDEVLVFSPSYANYSGFAAIAGVTLVPVECSLDDGFHAPKNTDDITQHITQNTRAILLCNPNNPTGTAFRQDEVQAILNICEKHDLFLIVDEVYREFVYENVPYSVLQIAPKHERVIVIDSVSKRYSLCGARVGCLITSNTDVMKAALNFASTRVSAPTIEMSATAHMLKKLSPDYLTRTVQEYKERRDVLVAGLQSIPNVEFRVPEGGFYALVKLPVEDARDFAQFMLRDFSMNNETLCISPASGFFLTAQNTPQNYVRIAFVVSQGDIQKSIEILKNALIVYLIKS